MRRYLIPLIAILLLPAAIAGAQTSGGASSDKGAIVSVIQQQLDAFQRDAGIEAFGYASPAIQGLFGTPETFMGMVRDGYAPVYRPRAYEFQGLDTSGPNPVQDVYIVGPDGEPVIARYTMQQQPDGTWRIHGCTLTRADGLTV